MKTVFVALALCAATPAFAGEKICFFSHGDSGAKGERFQADVSARKLVVKNATDGGSSWEGTFARSSVDPVKGRDGATYLDFDVEGSEGCTSILVDKELIKPEGKGNIKFVCRGEGFNQDVYFCRPDKNE